jgi:hypothetical protein
MSDMVTLDSTLVQRSDRLSATIEEVTAVMDPDEDAYLLFDAIGTVIWNRLAQPARLGDIVSELEAEYAVDTDTCSRDVLDFANDLVRRKMADIA